MRGQEFERMKDGSVFNSPMRRQNLQYEGMMPFDEPEESLCDVLMSLAADQDFA